jgi:hypothetical protein
MATVEDEEEEEEVRTDTNIRYSVCKSAASVLMSSRAEFATNATRTTKQL